MNSDMKKIQENINDELLEISSELINSKDDRSSLVTMCLDFENTWDIVIGTSKIPFKSKEEIQDKVEILKTNSDSGKVVVFGSALSGKSTLINALLTENILPISGSTSKFFVEINSSSNKRNYVVVNNTELDIADNDRLENILSSIVPGEVSLIKIFYDQTNCQLLNENITITEMPEMNNEQSLDLSIVEYCQDADLIILVVNAKTGLNDIEKCFFDRHRRMFSKLNIIIVYNFWDVVQSGDCVDLIKCQHINNSKQILCDQLQYNNTRAESNIFFISAVERMSIFRSDLSVHCGPLWDARNDSFASLYERLEKIISENAFNRGFRYLKELYQIIENTYLSCQSCVTQMREKRVELSIKLKTELNPLVDLNSQINKIISVIFNEAYEKLLTAGLEEIKVKAKPDDKQQIINISYSLNEDHLHQRLKMLLEDIIDVSLKNLKSEILKLLLPENEEISSLRKDIFNKLFFPFYFDLSNEINYFDTHNFKINLEEICRRIKIGKGITIGVTAGASAIGIATGGVAFAIIGLAEATIVAIAGLASGGAIAGSALGFGASFGAIKAVNKPFHFAWKENELNIMAMWNSFESALSNSYEKFLGNILSNITQLITPIEERLLKIQNYMNNIKEELSNFQNYSLIY